MKIQHNSSRYSGKIIAGFVLTAIGLGLLFQQLDWFFFPSWLFSWPMILIIVGLVKRANNPSNSSWLILIVIGCLFLVEKMFPGENVMRLGWPVIIIAAGLWMILRRKYEPEPENIPVKEAFADDDFLNPESAATEPPPINQSQTSTGEDYLSSFSVFGDVKKNIFSKTFKGGELVNIFAGTHLDFSHADISGRIVIDVMQLFGGTKLVVPPHWQVVSDIAPIFGGVSDKRRPNAELAASGKILVLKGVSVFGGVDVKSF